MGVSASAAAAAAVTSVKSALDMFLLKFPTQFVYPVKHELIVCTFNSISSKINPYKLYSFRYMWLLLHVYIIYCVDKLITNFQLDCPQNTVIIQVFAAPIL